MSSVLSITRGADFSATVKFANSNGSPIDLTGFSVTAAITWASTSLAFSVDVTDAAAGEATISLTEAQTLTIPDGKRSKLLITYTSGGGQTNLDRCDVEGL